MTNELEKQFFDTFGIEPKRGCTAYDKFTEEEADVICDDRCRACLYFDNVYPRITPEILLEFICILNDFTGIDVRATKIEELKGELLNHCIDLITYELNNIDDITNFRHQVRTLFEEG